MKKIFTLIAALFMLPLVVIAQPKLLKLQQPASTAPLLSVFKLPHTLSPASLSIKNIDTSDWTVAEGDWQYYSHYFKATYPTEIKYKYETNSPGMLPTALMALSNELGTFYLATNLVTGNTTSYFETDENDSPVYPKLGEGNVTLSTVLYDYDTNSHVSGSWAAYPLSGYARLLTAYYNYVDGAPDFKYKKIGYDYLYNNDALDVKIQADYARAYYNGEKNAKVVLRRGEGVTDVYYVMAQRVIDEKRPKVDSDWNENYPYYTVDRDFIKQYIAEYKAGETNPAYVVGRVDDNATEFEMPLPDGDGFTRMFIVAFNGDQITDMVFDMIERHNSSGWKDFGSVQIRNDLNIEGNSVSDIFQSNSIPLQINETGTRFRIINPFSPDYVEIPEANYLYINAEQGLDKCYIESSYSPVGYVYNINTTDQTNEQIYRPLLVQDLGSRYLFWGFKSENLSDSQLTFDLSNGYSPSSKMFMLEYNWQLYNEYNGSFFINQSVAGNVSFLLNNAVSPTTDAEGVNFMVGSDVDYLICSFEYDDISDNQTFRISADANKAAISVHSLLKNSQLPKNPSSIIYTAYDADDNILRTGTFDISGHRFDKMIGNLTYSDNEYWTNGKLSVTREDNPETGTSILTIENFGSTVYMGEPGTNAVFEFDENGLKTENVSVFVNRITVSNTLYDTYANLKELTYTSDYHNFVLSGKLYWECYDIDTKKYMGYIGSVDFSISIPENHMPLPLIDSSDWTVAEGDWQYYSHYFDKTYPTEVKYQYMTDSNGNPTAAKIALVNELGTYHLQTSLITGNASSLYAEYVDGGNIRSLLPVLNINGKKANITLRTDYTSNGYIGSWAAYPLSGYARLMTSYYPIKDESFVDEPFIVDVRSVDFSNPASGYDYLYNTQAPDAKIHADYARTYYNNEKTAKVILRRGEGVTDVYYVMGQSNMDEKRSLATPGWIEADIPYITLRSIYLSEYIAEYKAGETNPAYIVGRVDDNATEFEMPLPDKDGITRMYIIACKGNQITDHIFDFIEVHRPDSWKKHGSVAFDHNMIWATTKQPAYDLIPSATYPLEINESGTRFRIVNPFATSVNPESNYLYINAQYGLDKCYIEPSYAPVEHTYSITAPDHSVQQINRPYLMQGFVAWNIINGFDTENLKRGNQPVFDLTNGSLNVDDSSYGGNMLFAREYNMYLYQDAYGERYTNGSAVGDIGIIFSSAVVATPGKHGVDFSVGADVDHLVCSFSYGDTPVTKNADATSYSQTFRIDVNNGNASINICQLLKNGELTQEPQSMHYTAYDAADNTLRSSQLDLSDYSFINMTGECNLAYNDNRYLHNAQLTITRHDDLIDGIATYTVEKFSSSVEFANPDINLTFEVDQNGLKSVTPDNFFIETLRIGDTSYDCYAVLKNMTYTKNNDDAIISGKFIWACYEVGTTNYVGNYLNTDFTIAIPKDLSYELTSIDGIPSMDNSEDSAPVYYNLQGIRVDNPTHGTLLIEKKGNSSRKIIFD
ncbi:MAG: hypothetical protein K2O88_04445 [Paramuribaculum sp.]|nr:hypothetical protein [Paramuribaculum sp.]